MIQTTPMSNDWKQKLHERGFTSLSRHPDSSLEEFKQGLISFGGEAVILPISEPDLAKIKERGLLVMGEDALLIEGNTNNCHSNSSSNFVQHGHRIVTGYALSQDGVWRQHSWNIDKDLDRLIETTVLRLAYFGFELDQTEAETFAKENSQSEPVYKGRPPHWPQVDFVTCFQACDCRIRQTDDETIEVYFKDSLPDDMYANRLWVVEQADDRFYLTASARVDEIEIDEANEYSTKVIGDDALIYDPRVEIEYQILLDRFRGMAVGDNFITLNEEDPELMYLRPIAWAQYEDHDQNAAGSPTQE